MTIHDVFSIAAVRKCTALMFLSPLDLRPRGLGIVNLSFQYLLLVLIVFNKIVKRLNVFDSSTSSRVVDLSVITRRLRRVFKSELTLAHIPSTTVSRYTATLSRHDALLTAVLSSYIT